MVTIPITEARENLADLANRVSLRGERLIVERRGKSLFALVPVEDLEMLERIEDQMDLDSIRAARGEPSIPFEKLRKKLGL